MKKIKFSKLKEKTDFYWQDKLFIKERKEWFNARCKENQQKMIFHAGCEVGR
jgi:hypothetical protein